MSDHLPECPASKSNALARGYVCICHALRACEQRVRHERVGACIPHFDAGVAAARDAVAALAPTTVVLDGPLPVVHNVRITDALAAIDALRGDAPHLDPCDCDDCRPQPTLEPQPDTPTETIIMHNYEPTVGSVARCSGCGNVYVHKADGWVDSDDMKWGQPWSKIQTSFCGPVKVIYGPGEDE